MKTHAAFLILGLLGLLSSCPFAIVLGQQESDPFQIAGSNSAADPHTRALAQKPSFVFELDQSEEIQKFEFDLGTVKSSGEYVIEVRVASQLSGNVHFREISASCGSLSGFPKDIKLEYGEALPVRVSFRAPQDEEEFGETISLFDRKRDVHLQIKLKGKSKYAVKLQQNVFAVDRVGVSTFETEMAFPFADVDIDRLVIRSPSESILGWRVIGNGRSRKLIFDVHSDPSDIGEVVRLSVVQKGRPGVLCEIPIEIRRGERSIAKPSTVVLNDRGTECMGRVRIQYRGLTNPNDRLDRKLKGIAKRKDDGSVLEFEVNATLIGVSEFVTLAELRVTDAQILGNPNDFELSVEFQSSMADVPTFVVPMEYDSRVR